MALFESDHPDIPTMNVLSHEHLFRPFRRVGPKEIALYEEKHADRALVGFLRDYSENGSAWASRVERAQSEMTKTFGNLDAALRDTPWLGGDAYGLADISWVVNAHRMNQAQLDLSAWPRLQYWSQRAMERPAFDRAVFSYQP